MAYTYSVINGLLMEWDGDKWVEPSDRVVELYEAFHGGVDTIELGNL